MLKESDIVIRTNLKCPETGKLDLCIGGHPTLNITSSETKANNKIYFLGITGSTSGYAKNLKDEDKLLLRPLPKLGIVKPSVVKLDHILSEDYKNIPSSGMLNETIYIKVVEKLHKSLDKKDCNGSYCSCAEYKENGFQSR